MNIVFNVWDADVWGSGEHSGLMLTAYHADDDLAVTDQYVSLPVRQEDLPWSARVTVDDHWVYPKGKHYNKLMQLFISNLIKEKYYGTK